MSSHGGAFKVIMIANLLLLIFFFIMNIFIGTVFFSGFLHP